MAPSPWSGQSYKPHRGGADMIFYHVFDDLSQTPYIHGVGIKCGNRKRNAKLKTRIERLIIRDRVYEHFRWKNRNATVFISLWSIKAKAERQARMRANQLSVKDPLTGRRMRRDPRSIEIAEISSARLDAAGVHYFSTKWLKKILNLKPTDKDWKTLSNSEWLAIVEIPDDCVLLSERYVDL